MIMYGLRFNVRQKPEKVVYPRDINGENLLEVFDGWCNENMNAALHRASSDDWIWIKRTSVDQNKNVACVDIQTGKAGEAGELVDTSESNPSIPFSEYHAPTVDARVVLYVPPKCDVAYACVEHVVHGGSDIFFLDSFKRGFDERFPKITLNRVRVIETMDLWKQFEGMSEIELRFMSPSKDIADGPCMKDGFLSYRLQHRRSKRFSLGLFESISADTNSISIIDILIQLVLPILIGVICALFNLCLDLGIIASVVATISALMCAVAIMLYQTRIQLSNETYFSESRQRRLIDELFSDIAWIICVGFLLVMLIVFLGRFSWITGLVTCLLSHFFLVGLMCLKRINSAYEILKMP